MSGNNTKEALKALTDCESFRPRYATLKRIQDPDSKQIIDNGLILYFNSPRSFTGEDSCEFQVHGGPAVVSALLKALSKVNGLRPAEPGEFTRRAFNNGKMDLTEVEGLADLIHAETEFQRRQALIQADGHLSKLYSSWRTQLIRNIAHVEAFIDFAEDENIEVDVLSKTRNELDRIDKEIMEHLNDNRIGERLREGVRLAILGATNVGKSSLTNVLVQRDVSIVTEIEGTTRDVIETSFDIGGYPVIISDTAGFRESEDIVEAEGIARARKCAALADLILVVIDGRQLEEYFSDEKRIDIGEYKKMYMEQLGLTNAMMKDRKLIYVVNKVDLMSHRLRVKLEALGVSTLSCTQLINIDKVLTEITDHLKQLCGDPSAESPVLSQVRHRHFIQECSNHIQEFLASFDPSREWQDLAILVQSLRNAVRSIGKITGEVRTDDVLDVIFKDFCIGK